MVVISARRSEDSIPTPPKKLSRHLLHLVSRAQMSPKEAAREPQVPSRSIWRQAIHGFSSPAAFKKNARIAALEKTCRVSNQNESQTCSINANEEHAIDGQERNDKPQDETSVQPESSSRPCKTTAEEDNNLHDLSHSVKKLALSSLRVIHPTSASPLKVLQSALPESPLSIVKRASLYQELREFCGNGDTHITMFPDYFSEEEKLMVQKVAHELQLGCQVGEKNIAVFKLVGGHQLRTQRLNPPHLVNHNGVNEDVYVDVHELAQHGKDGFIAKLRLRRMSSGTGIRRNMLWDVAELSSTADGMADPMSEGEGGVYAVQSRSSGQKLALFKPAEEEKFVRQGLSVGEGAVREEAAYVLDSQSNGFSGVPPTAVARLRLANVGRAKQGAVQRFMASSIGSMDSFGMPFDLEKARAFVPVEQVQRIALLDVRVFNTDRHPGNILLIGDKKPYTMVPIDHGCILPSWFHLSEARFDWLEYPQTREAFSHAALQYIDALDAERDAKTLRGLGIREECVTTLKICTLFLKLAAAQGKTLFWMGNFMTRDGCFQEPSRLELTVQSACERAGIPFTFKPNEFDEKRGEIDTGVLSRRPPSEFFLALEHLLLEAINSDES
ncbi:Phosphatidyl inositol kinase [Phytophthora megakarya]|uniref:Phosphatidyl inositol kinase n=1 Tax=Phytophthora megakarya TaxID=4795 RepID=A0A225X4A6_9STRA|nr:Phosphatidyl inositol kinase [Phytophthora megakarya]